MDQQVYQNVMRLVKKVVGIDLTHYKDEQMKRRLDSWLIRAHETDWETYFARVQKDPDEFTRFRNYLTINVTEFFRDAERWDYLAKIILPELLRESLKNRTASEGLRIWSAGCSVGPEPYSLAMLLDELAPMKKHYLLATDYDRGALQRAKDGGPYITDDLKNVSPERRRKYFTTSEPPFYVGKNVQRLVTFREQNMLQDPFENRFDLIVCRNVVIYFTSQTKEMLYKKFCDSIREGGIFFVGGTEIIPRPQEYNMRSHGISFYKKLESVK